MRLEPQAVQSLLTMGVCAGAFALSGGSSLIGTVAAGLLTNEVQNYLPAAWATIEQAFGSAPDPNLPANADLARALRRAHLLALRYLIARHGELDGSHRFTVAAGQWVEGQLSLLDEKEIGWVPLARDEVDEVGRLLEAAEPGERANRLSQLARLTEQNALEDFRAGCAVMGRPLPDTFGPIFAGGAGQGPGWAGAAQTFFTHILKHDEAVRTVVFMGQFASAHAKLDSALAACGDIGERISRLEIGLQESRAAAVADALSRDDFYQRFEALFPAAASNAYLAADQVAHREAVLTRRFFGREADLEALDRAVEGSDRGVILLTAPAGTGKSALCARWVACRRQLGDWVARHFISIDPRYPQTVDQLDIVRHLDVQIRALTPDKAAMQSDASSLRDDIARRCGQDQPEGRRLIVVIDGLDEAASEILPVFGASLGRGVHVLVSCRRSRPGAIPTALSKWHVKARDLHHDDLELKGLTRNDIALWVRGVSAATLSPQEATTISGALSGATEGLTLFVRFMLESFTERLAGTSPQARTDLTTQLPKSFDDYVRRVIDGLDADHPAGVWSAGVQFVFATLALAKAPISGSDLRGLLRIAREKGMDVAGAEPGLRFHHRVERWLAIAEDEDRERRYAFAHPKLAEVFVRVLGDRVDDAAAALLADAQSWRERTEYRLTAAAEHLVDAALAGQVGSEEAAAPLSDFHYLLARGGSPLGLQSAVSALARLEFAPGHPGWLALWRACVARSAPLTRAFSADAQALPMLVVETFQQGLDAYPLLACPADLKRIAKSERNPQRVPGLLEGHTYAVYGALALADGRLLSWGGDGTLRLWDGQGGTLATLEGHESTVKGALALADDRLLSWSEDRTFRLWDLQGGTTALLEGHDGWVSGALALADGRLLSWGWDGTLRLWDSEGGALATLEGHKGWVHGALVLADGRLLSWSEDSTLRLWNAEGGTLATLEGHKGWVNGALALPDGRLLSWGRDGTLRIWDAEGAALATLEGHEGWVDGALALADGHLLSWSMDGTLRIWDAQGGALSTVEGHESWVNGALELADGRLLSWSNDRTLRIWDVEGRALATLRGHEGAVSGALALADGRLLSRSEDRTLRLWDAEGGALATLEGHVSWVSGAFELADGRLLSRSRDGTLRIWDAEGRALATLEGHNGAVSGALALADGRLLSTSSDRTLRIWDAEGRALATLEGHKGNVTGALALADNRLLSWSDDQTLRLWDAEGGALATLKGHEGAVDGALALADGRLLSWSSDETLRLWGAEGGALTTLEGHKGWVHGALALADGRLLSWGGDKNLRLWDALGGALATLEGHKSWVHGALALSDGRLLSRSEDKTLRLWDAQGGALATLEGHNSNVGGALELADGRLLSWSNDRTLRIWNAQGGALTTLEGHEGSVSGAQALADGRLLSWGNDRTLRLWGAQGGALATLEGHKGWVTGALPLADGRLLSWSDDGTLQLWDAEGHNRGLWTPFAGPIKGVVPLLDLRFAVLCDRHVLFIDINGD